MVFGHISLQFIEWTNQTKPKEKSNIYRGDLILNSNYKLKCYPSIRKQKWHQGSDIMLMKHKFPGCWFHWCAGFSQRGKTHLIYLFQRQFPCDRREILLQWKQPERWWQPLYLISDSQCEYSRHLSLWTLFFSALYSMSLIFLQV